MNSIFKMKKSTVGMVVVSCLLLVYIVGVTWFTWSNNNQIKVAIKEPYNVIQKTDNIQSTVMFTNRYLRLLLMEDNKDNLDAIKKLLYNNRYKNQIALNALKESFLKDSADVATLEENLNKMDQSLLKSLELFAEKQENDAKLKEYFNSEVTPAYLEAEWAVESIKKSADAYLADLNDKINENTTRGIWYAVILGLWLIWATGQRMRSEVKFNDDLQRRNLMLQDALKNAQKASEAKQQFLSRMSHEIRTPLNAIIGMNSIAYNYLDNPSRLEDCLGKIGFSSKHLLMLINDVLDMAKIEDGKLNISQDVFDLKKIIESLTDIHYSQANAKNQSFEIIVSGFDEEMLIGDEMRVNQVLINLLSNAIKFTPQGGSVKLEITCVHRTANSILLRFSVQDTGIGMDEKFLKNIYEPFEQANGSIAQKYGGTGLGMSITKNLVTLMNGTINVKSVEGSGTTFDVELPFGLPGNGGITKNPALEKLNALIVDDDRDSCEHVSLLLEKMGVRSDWLLDGNEAVEKVRTTYMDENERYNVYFVDWCMPNLSGLETVRQIRQYVGPDVLVVVISAYDFSVIEEQARAAGVDGFIVKPFFASAIYDTLLQIVQKNELDQTTAKEHQDKYNFKGKKILLAEDNDINAEIATELLSLVELEVAWAHNGQEALDMFNASGDDEYALILMDIQMPLMDGYEAARKIRMSTHPSAQSVPIIAMTANAFREDVQAALDAGMNGHVSKPIELELLYKTLANYL